MHFINQLIAEGQTEFPVFEGSLGLPEKLIPSLSDQELNDGQFRQFRGSSTETVDVVSTGDGSGTEGKGKWIIGTPASESSDEETSRVISSATKPLTPKAQVASPGELRSPPPLQEYKVDEKYIARYLGDLTPEEESGLVQLGKRFQVSGLNHNLLLNQLWKICGTLVSFCE